MERGLFATTYIYLTMEENETEDEAIDRLISMLLQTGLDYQIYETEVQEGDKDEIQMQTL